MHCDALGACATRVEAITFNVITGAGVTITVPARWTTTHEDGFETSVYYFADRGQRMFSARFVNDIGLNPVLGDPAIAETPVVLNGLQATEYRRIGDRPVLTAIDVENRCGGFKHVWLYVVSKDPEKLAEISSAMRSVACIPLKPQ
jgi:hypothetical protein